MGGVVSAAQAVTLQSVAALRQDLQTALATSDSVVLDCSGLEDADLSFVQLIAAARKEASGATSTLTLSQPANAGVAALLKRAGFLDRPTPDDIEFWFHGDLPE